MLSCEIHPKQNRTSDFKNILDYNYLGPKHSKFFGSGLWRNSAVFQCD